MSDKVQIRRYPNRRFYSRQDSRYVSLEEIEQLVQAGQQVEIRDSQTDEDLTRVVLTRIILDRYPEKMLLFPVDMLHFILRSNEVMSGFLRDYFRHSLTYLEYLQRHGTSGPMHWVRAWLDGIRPRTGTAGAAGEAGEEAEAGGPDAGPVAAGQNSVGAGQAGPSQRETELARRVEELEDRLRQLEAQQRPARENPSVPPRSDEDRLLEAAAAAGGMERSAREEEEAALLRRLRDGRVR
ncbi:MAG: polyhydroxyalkanoate synthesis regulator DNA-binding domain-containing protein [Pirellulaceae bacterium]|nr:polyhydroxyalkanoate synthesis regulator DNA-binding domain-containing protein [Pirellulaceae bacterium]